VNIYLLIQICTSLIIINLILKVCRPCG